MKRMAAPSSWMLDKMTGVWAPKPSAGPHPQKECIPVCVLLRNKLKYALTMTEAKMISIQRFVKVDGKVRTDHTFPIGYQDVVSLEKTKEHFRILYDTKGRWVLHRITPAEATYKLLRVQSVEKGPKGVNYCTTHDGRTIRFPHPDIKANDTLRYDYTEGKVLEYAKFEHGSVCMVLGGNNKGRVGTITKREKHPGGFEIVHLVDKRNHHFATRIGNVQVIGVQEKAWISLPKGEGIALDIVETRKKKMAANGSS